MNIMGGKFRQGPKIARHIAPLLVDGINYHEPFCGAMGVANNVAKVNPNINMFLSDINQYLICTWDHLLNGWVPPDVITEEVYNYYKTNKPINDPMTGYCGFGMSFGGKWFGGYARNGVGTEYVIIAKRSSLLKVSSLSLKCCNYLNVVGSPGSVYVMDPPYNGRTRAHGVDFDSLKFWDHVRFLVDLGCKVFITEFVAPEDFVSVLNFGDTVVRHYASLGSDGTRECLFVHKSQAGIIR